MKFELRGILLVEDSQDDADLLAGMLSESTIRCELVHAARLSEAKTYLESKDIDIVLLDLSLPDSYGVATVTAVSRYMAASRPIIVLTGQDDEDLAAQALQNGAQDYLIKGEVDGRQITRAIRYAIERHRLLADLKQSMDERRHLESTLTSVQMQQLWKECPVTAVMAGVGPLKTREAQQFQVLLNIYGELLETYLNDLGYQRQLPRLEIDMLAQQIGRMSGGPRDVIELHLHTMNKKLPVNDLRKAQSYTMEGRLFSLEVMGYLVDFYRLHGSTSPDGCGDAQGAQSAAGEKTTP